jgi:FdhD protein
VGDRPRVGISACLLGEPVRYDGRHKRDDGLLDALGAEVDWVAVCPEVEAGFGTPREPMDLVANAGGVALMTISTGRDMTTTMQRYAERRVAELAHLDLDGYVLKSESPSCGINDVPLRSPDGIGARLHGSGLFAHALMTRLPALPITDERRLQSAGERQAFVARVHAHRRARATGPLSFQPVDIVRVREGRRTVERDHAATEEPLEIRLHGRPFAVIMRTPGRDRELAAGFLLAERVIRTADELGTIEYCTGRDGSLVGPAEAGPHARGLDVAGPHARGLDVAGPHGAGPHAPKNPAGLSAPQNVVDVTLSNGSEERLAHLLDSRRQVTTHASCGLCGRRTIESLATDVDPIRASWTVAAAAITGMPDRLREKQTVFDETGGLHAAGLFAVDAGGVGLVDVAEDVGRHNAVDKIVGRMLMREALPLSTHVLCVSGRTSFEIVQKALFAGIPVVAAVSAPSTLAIELADAFGITLVGFVRGAGFTIYSHARRIEG